MVHFALFHLAMGIYLGSLFYLPPSHFCKEYPLVHQDLVLIREEKKEKPTCSYLAGSSFCSHANHPLCCLTFDPFYVAASPRLHGPVHCLSSPPASIPSHKFLFLFLISVISIEFLFPNQFSAVCFIFVESWSGTALSGTKGDPRSLQTITDF